MSDDLTVLRAAFEELRSAIVADNWGDDPERKVALAHLYRAVSTSLADVTQLRDDVRAFVDQWKKHQDTPKRVSRRTTGTAPVHQDHIGASTFCEKGWSYIAAGDGVSAEQELQRAVSLAPTDATARALLAWAQILQDDVTTAAHTIQRALKYDPSNALARVMTGYLSLVGGRYGEAIGHLSKALRQKRDVRARLYANLYLGLVYAERAMYDDAQVFFERAIAIGPNLGEAYFELGHAIWAAGDRDRALTVWRRGAETNPSAPWKKRCADAIAHAERGETPERPSRLRA